MSAGPQSAVSIRTNRGRAASRARAILTLACSLDGVPRWTTGRSGPIHLGHLTPNYDASRTLATSRSFVRSWSANFSTPVDTPVSRPELCLSSRQSWVNRYNLIAVEDLKVKGWAGVVRAKPPQGCRELGSQSLRVRKHVAASCFRAFIDSSL
jgi:hypothetical protein